MAQDSTYTPGSRYDSTDPILLNLQTPTGLPRSSALVSVTDPISPTPRTSERLRHFFDGVYDLSAESHLSILLKVILGDGGIGGLSKQFSVSRQQSMILTTRYGDLDKLYGALLGLHRLTEEILPISPYHDIATDDEWDEIEAQDAAYRARIETFVRGLPLAGTPGGMAAIAQAVVGVPCRVLETYQLVDENGDNPGGSPPSMDGRTYGEVEDDYIYYNMMVGTYADIEGGTGIFGRTTNLNRSEFVVIPKRPISLEEHYHLIKILSRFKPADALLTVNPNGVEIHSQVTLRQVYADSTYWTVTAKVSPVKALSAAYTIVDPGNLPKTQPRPVFAGYQGEAWSYNSDVKSVTSYTQTSAGVLKDRYNYERIVVGQTSVDFSPDKAVMDTAKILVGRMVSDGILSITPYDSRQLVS